MGAPIKRDRIFDHCPSPKPGEPLAGAASDFLAGLFIAAIIELSRRRCSRMSIAGERCLKTANCWRSARFSSTTVRCPTADQCQRPNQEQKRSQHVSSCRALQPQINRPGRRSDCGQRQGGALPTLHGTSGSTYAVSHMKELITLHTWLITAKLCAPVRAVIAANLMLKQRRTGSPR
jgi:hypothetical protein